MGSTSRRLEASGALRRAGPHFSTVLGVGAVLVSPFPTNCDLDYGALNPADANGLMLPNGSTAIPNTSTTSAQRT